MLGVEPHHNRCIVHECSKESLVKAQGLTAEKVEAVVAAEEADGAIILNTAGAGGVKELSRMGRRW